MNSLFNLCLFIQGARNLWCQRLCVLFLEISTLPFLPLPSGVQFSDQKRHWTFDTINKWPPVYHDFWLLIDATRRHWAMRWSREEEHTTQQRTPGSATSPTHQSHAAHWHRWLPAWMRRRQRKWASKRTTKVGAMRWERQRQHISCKLWRRRCSGGGQSVKESNLCQLPVQIATHTRVRTMAIIMMIPKIKINLIFSTFTHHTCIFTS